MNNLNELKTFLGWCTVINVVVLFLAAVAVMTLGNWMTGLHSSMFGIGQDQLSQQYFQYLANYKIAIFVFNLTPYVSLRLLR